MLPNAPSTTAQHPQSREERRQRLRSQLLAVALPAIDHLVETLLEAPDRELFRSVEVQARDLGQRLAAATQQAGLDDRKKGGT